MNRLTLFLSFLLILSLLLAPTTAASDDELWALSYHDTIIPKSVHIVAQYDAFTLIRGSSRDINYLLSTDIYTRLLTDRTHIHLPGGTIDTSNIHTSLHRSPDDIYLLQLIGPVKQYWAASIERHADILDYRPQNTYIIKCDPSLITTIENLPFVEWMGAYKTAWRIHPDVSDKQQAVTVRFYPGHNPSQLQSKGVQVIAQTPSSAIVVNPNLTALATTPGISSIEPYTDPHLLNRYARAIILASIIHNEGIIGRDQIGAVTDTGVYLDHDMFSEQDKIVTFIDWVGDATLSGGDGDGHGTHVAGSMLGDAPGYGGYYINDIDDGQGLGAQLIPVKVFNNAGMWAAGDDQYLFWTEAWDEGARVNNNSWGVCSGGNYGLLDYDADQVVWEHDEYVMVMAAGNCGQAGPSTTISPANAKNVITVGAVNTYSPGDIAPFSSRGPTRDFRIKPDVVAPGNPINSALRGTVSGYIEMSGTSMAAPQVAGAALLVRDYFSQGFSPSGEAEPEDEMEPSAALVKAVLINGAMQIHGERWDWNGEGVWPNNAQGWGRINLDRSLYFDGDERKVTYADRGALMETGAEHTCTFTLDHQAKDLKFTLVWTDFPGMGLIQDLDLKVTGPDGSVFIGNNFEHNYTPEGSWVTPDNTNNVEGVHLVGGGSYPWGAVPEGSYEITITAANLPMGRQEYAMVISWEYDYHTPPPLKIAIVEDPRQTYGPLVGPDGSVHYYPGDDIGQLLLDLPLLDVVIVNEINNNVLVDQLLSAVATEEKGIVFLSRYPVQGTAIDTLRIRYSDPIDLGSNYGHGPVTVTVTDPHPILGPYGIGQDIIISSGGGDHYQSFAGYSGTIIASSSMPQGYSGAVAYKDRMDTGGARHVVLASFGSSIEQNPDLWTEEGLELFQRAVQWAGGRL